MRRFPILAPFALFCVLIGGVDTFKNSKQRLTQRDFDLHGLRAAAEITHKIPPGLYEGPGTYSLRVGFGLPDGGGVATNIQVPKAYYEGQTIPSSATVLYLPESPTEAVIEGARMPHHNILGGLGILTAGLAAGSKWLWRKRSHPSHA